MRSRKECFAESLGMLGFEDRPLRSLLRRREDARLIEVVFLQTCRMDHLVNECAVILVSLADVDQDEVGKPQAAFQGASTAFS